MAISLLFTGVGTDVEFLTNMQSVDQTTDFTIMEIKNVTDSNRALFFQWKRLTTNIFSLEQFAIDNSLSLDAVSNSIPLQNIVSIGGGSSLYVESGYVESGYVD